MKANIDKNATYFCFHASITTIRATMEAEIFDFAKSRVLYYTIEGCWVKYLVKELEDRRDELEALHPNRRKVEISCHNGMDGLFWISIGQSRLSFRKIIGEY